MEDHSLLFWARPLRETPIPSGSAGPGPIFLSPRVRGDLFAVANPRLGREATAWSIGSPTVFGQVSFLGGLSVQCDGGEGGAPDRGFTRGNG